MKGFGMLLLYFFTWRSVIVGSVLLGLVVLALAMGLAALAPRGAIAMALLAFVLLLAVPYLSAPKALRTLISNRRLAMVPGLPVRTGLAMCLLTALTAVFLPLCGLLLGAPGAFVWLGIYIFILASLYTLVGQLLVTSRYLWVHVQWLPVAVMLLLSQFGKQLLQLATSAAVVGAIAAAACAGWLWMLVRLARRPNFKPAYATDMNMADQDTNSLFSSWVNRGPRQRLAPVTSLVQGYPANRRSRAMNILFLVVFNPLLSVLLVKLMDRNDHNVRIDGTTLFLAMSLLTSFIAGALAWAETGPRARLLWLRVPGARPQVWAKLERDLWDYFVVLLGVTAVVVAVAWSQGEELMLLVHYALLLFTLAYFQRYLPLAARLNGWSSLGQALVSLGSLVVIGLTLVYSLRLANFNLFFLLELCLVLLGTLFRAFAKFGFSRVDWMVLRPVPSKRAGAAA